MTRGDELLRRAAFDEAGAWFEDAAAGGSAEARLKLGEIALLRNDLAEAESHLVKLVPSDDEAIVAERDRFLAEMWTRQDRFGEAAPRERAIGQDARADRAEAIPETGAYLVSGADNAVVPFVRTDPLPVLEATVHGETAKLFIDTGAWELILDDRFAERVGIRTFGAVRGQFAGGRTADVEVGLADVVSLDSMDVRNVPVHVKAMEPMTRSVLGEELDGVIGTVFLYHFLSTLDYANGALRLEPRGSRPSTVAQAVPFWLAGRHFVLAQGEVNGHGPMLFHIDTGLAGGGFLCGPSTIERAGIALDETRAAEGMGGGGPVRVIPVDIEQLALGPVRRGPVQGIFAEAHPSEAYGLELGGIVSHQFFREGSVAFDFDRMRLHIT